ncbi:hypothetical protein NL676_009009 [Syzygium grande]|nr:hypothetical protein NL676_009009 [Syzygium grande]
MSICYTPIRKLPNQMEGLESLLELDLSYTRIRKVPACIGNLKRLEVLYIDLRAIRKLPKATGTANNLKALNLAFWENLDGEGPREMIVSASSRERELTLPDGTPPLSEFKQGSPKIEWIEGSLFSNLTNLSSLCLLNCRLREVEFDDTLGQQLEKLPRLELKDSAALERLLISRLEGLQEFSVTDFPGLMEAQGLEKSKSFEAVP